MAILSKHEYKQLNGGPQSGGPQSGGPGVGGPSGPPRNNLEPASATLSDAERAMARKWGITDEEYGVWKS